MGVHREADAEREAERKRLRRKHRREKEGDRGRENRNATVANNPPDSPEDTLQEVTAHGSTRRKSMVGSLWLRCA